MIVLVFLFALAGEMALLMAMEAFLASHEFVCWWCLFVTIILWSRYFLVVHVVCLRCCYMAVISPHEA